MAVEATRVVGHERVPEVAVGDDHPVVGAALAVGGRDLPAAGAALADRPHPRHGRVEADLASRARGARRSRGCSRASGRGSGTADSSRGIGCALEARRVARRDQVQAVVVRVPVAADTIAGSKQSTENPSSRSTWRAPEAGSSGTDHAVVHATQYRVAARQARELIDCPCRRRCLRQTMTLQQLTYFLAAAEHGSFTAAADVLRLARPSVSEQIAHLEAELGVALFVRAGRRLQLTDAGRLLVPEAERTLAAAREASDAVRRARTLTGGTASLGTFSTADHLLLPRLVEDFAQRLSGRGRPRRRGELQPARRRRPRRAAGGRPGGAARRRRRAHRRRRRRAAGGRLRQRRSRPRPAAR